MMKLRNAGREHGRGIWIVGALTALLVATVLMPSAQAATTAKEPDLSGVEITVATGVVTQQIGGLAGATGSYTNTPYKINWVNFPSGAQQLQTVSAGNADLAIGIGDTSINVAQANALEPWTKKSAPLKIIAQRCPLQTANPSSVLFAKANSGIKSVKDLKGKSITYSAGGWQELLVYQALAKAGMTKDDFKPVILDFASGLNAFISGSVDAAAMPNVAIGQATDAGGVQLATSRDVPNMPTCTNALTSAQSLSDPGKKAALKDFIGRMTVAENWQSDPNNGPTVLSLCQKPPISQPLATCASYAAAPRPIVYPINAAMLKTQQGVADAQFKAGIIPKKVDVKVQYDTYAQQEILDNLSPTITPTTGPYVAKVASKS
jgi:sulfonate transport system substrate-binding protein